MVQSIKDLRKRKDILLIDDASSERYANDQDFAKSVDKLYVEFSKHIEELDAKRNKEFANQLAFTSHLAKEVNLCPK